MKFFLSVFGNKRLKLFPESSPPLEPVQSMSLTVTYASGEVVQMSFDPSEVQGIIQQDAR